MLLLCLLFGWAAPPWTPLPSQIEALIRQLGDDDFDIRERASKRLREAGEAAEAALEKAAESDDAETKKRARAILEDFKLGIYPGTPPQVAGLARRYAAATAEEKRGVIGSLLATGAPGARTLIRLIKSEADAVSRREALSSLASQLPVAAALLLDTEERTILQALLHLASQSESPSGPAHFAAYHLLTGQAPARIAALEEQARAAPPGKKEHELLFWLHRARGDLPRARDATKKAERPDLAEAAMLEAADWKGLDDDPSLAPDGEKAMQLGFRAAYARLAGNKKRHAQAADELATLARPIAREGGPVLTHAKGLFFNSRTSQAIELLAQSRAEPRMLFHLHAAALRYSDAFALAKAARDGKQPDATYLTLQEAKARWHLGQKEEALALTRKAAAEVRAGIEDSWPIELVEAEVLMGRRDEAFAHAAALSLDGKSGWPARLMGALFPAYEQDAQAVWAVIADMPGKSSERLGLLRQLFEGKASADDLRRVAKAAEVPGPDPSPVAMAALAEAALLCGQEKLARDYFSRAGAPGKVRLGDLLVKKKQHTEAVAQYEQAYRKALRQLAEPKADGVGVTHALALYLSGKALAAAGRPSEGKARMEKAHLLLLGDGEARNSFLKALRKRGERQAALSEARLLARLGDPVVTSPGNYWTAEGVRALAMEHEKEGKELQASDLFEVVFLGCLTPGVTFTRPQAYITVPSYLRKLRAVGLARAGKMDEALEVAKDSLACWSGNLDLAIALVPLLEKAGRKAEAARLYRDIQAPQEALLKEYPKSPLLLNQLAWLAAACRREPHRAVQWAEKAVELSPGTSAYHDTQAEALFQAGKKAEAVAAIKKAIAIDPKRAYYRNQLKRLEKGTPETPLPREDEGLDDE